MSGYLERHHAIYGGLLNSESPWEVWLKDHFRKLTWWSSFWDFAFQRGWCGFDPWSGSWNPTCLGAIEAKHKQRQCCGKFNEEFKKKKTILICKRRNLFCESELWWGKKTCKFDVWPLKDHRRPCVHTLPSPGLRLFPLAALWLFLSLLSCVASSSKRVYRSSYAMLRLQAFIKPNLLS